jgi:hypothetical protein
MRAAPPKQKRIGEILSRFEASIKAKHLNALGSYPLIQQRRDCSGPQLRDTAWLLHAAAGSGASCAALMAAGVW